MKRIQILSFFFSLKSLLGHPVHSPVSETNIVFSDNVTTFFGFFFFLFSCTQDMYLFFSGIYMDISLKDLNRLDLLSPRPLKRQKTRLTELHIPTHRRLSNTFLFVVIGFSAAERRRRLIELSFGVRFLFPSERDATDVSIFQDAIILLCSLLFFSSCVKVSALGWLPRKKCINHFAGPANKKICGIVELTIRQKRKNKRFWN